MVTGMVLSAISCNAAPESEVYNVKNKKKRFSAANCIK